MQLIVHRGSHEVGGNCVEVISGNSRIILDLGLPLFDSERKPLDSWRLRRADREQLSQQSILPRVSGLFDEGHSSPDAILISHAHMDHTGLIQHSRPEIPIYSSSGTSKMMLAGKLFAAQVELPRSRFHEVQPETPFQIGPFTITGFPVDHSIYGCLAYLIEADGQSILYSGDLRMHGRKPGMHRRLLDVMSRRPPLDLLLMEGTHFGLPDGELVDEYKLEAQILCEIRNSPGLVLASFSPQHVDRLVAFIRATIQSGRTFIADVYTAFVLHLIGNEIKVPVPGRDQNFLVYVPAALQRGNRKSLRSIVEKFGNGRVEIEKIIAAPKQFVMVFRPSMLEDFGTHFPTDTKCIYSRWEGYLESDDWKRLSQTLTDRNGKLTVCHTSGHIHSKDILTFLQALNPRRIIPIHTFAPDELLAIVPNVSVVNEGEVIEVI